MRKDHRTLTADEQSRFVNAFTQINAMNHSQRSWSAANVRVNSSVQHFTLVQFAAA
jgi:hypothetical protein